MESKSPRKYVLYKVANVSFITISHLKLTKWHNYSHFSLPTVLTEELFGRIRPSKHFNSMPLNFSGVNFLVITHRFDFLRFSPTSHAFPSQNNQYKHPTHLQHYQNTRCDYIRFCSFLSLRFTCIPLG